MNTESTRERLIYNALLENVDDRAVGIPSDEASLIAVLDHIIAQPDSSQEALRVVRDITRWAGAILHTVLGPDDARKVLFRSLLYLDVGDILESENN